MRTFLFTLLALAFVQGKEQIAHLTLPSGVHISITEAPFRGSGISIEGCNSSSKVCRIGGQPYGLATGLPKTYIRNIVATYGTSKFILDSSGIYDAEVLQHTDHPGIRFFGGSCQDSKNCTFRAVLGDAANSVAAEWIVIDGTVQRTVLTGDPDIIEFFEKNIDPPTYE